MLLCMAQSNRAQLTPLPKVVIKLRCAIQCGLVRRSLETVLNSQSDDCRTLPAYSYHEMCDWALAKHATQT